MDLTEHVEEVSEHQVDVPLSTASFHQELSEPAQLHDESLEAPKVKAESIYKQYQTVQENALLLLKDCSKKIHRKTGLLAIIIYVLFFVASVVVLAKQDETHNLTFWLSFYLIMKAIEKIDRYRKFKMIRLSFIDYLMRGFPKDKNSTIIQIILFITVFMGIIAVHRCTCANTMQLYYFCNFLIGMELISYLIICTVLSGRQVILRRSPDDILVIVKKINNLMKIGPQTVPEFNVKLFDDTCEQKTCTVCLDNYVAGSEVRSLPCNHDFHKACVDRWFGVAPTCPLCRSNMKHM